MKLTTKTYRARLRAVALNSLPDADSRLQAPACAALPSPATTGLFFFVIFLAFMCVDGRSRLSIL